MIRINQNQKFPKFYWDNLGNCTDTYSCFLHRFLSFLVVVQFRTQFSELDRFECFHSNCFTSLLWTCDVLKLYRYVTLSFLFLMIHYLVSYMLMELRLVPPRASGPITGTLPCIYELVGIDDTLTTNNWTYWSLFC